MYLNLFNTVIEKRTLGIIKRRKDNTVCNSFTLSPEEKKERAVFSSVFVSTCSSSTRAAS